MTTRFHDGSTTVTRRSTAVPRRLHDDDVLSGSIQLVKFKTKLSGLKDASVGTEASLAKMEEELRVLQRRTKLAEDALAAEAEASAEEARMASLDEELPAEVKLWLLLQVCHSFTW